MKYSKEHEKNLQNVCDSINSKSTFKVQIIYRNNKYAIVFGNGNESIEPYNYDCANGILQGIVKIMQLERGRK
jgi:hypothetical protein